MVEKLCRYVNPFSYNTSVLRTDRRTDRRTYGQTELLYQYRAPAGVCWRAIKITRRSILFRNVIMHKKSQNVFRLSLYKCIHCLYNLHFLLNFLLFILTLSDVERPWTDMQSIKDSVWILVVYAKHFTTEPKNYETTIRGHSRSPATVSSTEGIWIPISIVRDSHRVVNDTFVKYLKYKIRNTFKKCIWNTFIKYFYPKV